MSRVRFHPIESEAEFVEAIRYVAYHAKALGFYVTSRKIDVVSARLYSGSNEEYTEILGYANLHGDPSKEIPDDSYCVDIHADSELAGGTLRHIGVWHPNPNVTIAKVGQGVLMTDEMDDVLRTVQIRNRPGGTITETEGGLQIVKLSHPGFDVDGIIRPEL